MPRPEPNIIQLTIDGREVRAPEGMMLVDAAKQGDIEIPYFCYEPKLGAPVGACRMCLVEIEGIPKLQTSCSTAVKDGMVVHTQTDRVHHAQNAIVEFLLVNHPLDCPVCDKGGECPLQDITFGWGLGRSRFIEPKRHFEKPLALSPVIAIDRERCILCYRCVRFSQEIAEDYQLVFESRGAHTFVGTHNGHPYVAPFSGNIVELCPVGALTSQPYRFRARPWDIEGAGGICTLCPSQCNVEFTVRDEKVVRVRSRDATGAATGGGPGGNPDVDDGWLCDKGRFAYQAIHVDERIIQPLVRDGGSLRPVSWERAFDAAAGLARHRGAVGALVGGQATNEEGFLIQRIMREALRSGDLDCRSGEQLPPGLTRALAAPALQATVVDLEFAHTVLVLGCEPLDDAPIFDLRIRKGVRRHGVRLAIATDRPSALDPNARLSVRVAPGGEAEFLAALDVALESAASGSGYGSAAESDAARLAEFLLDGGEDIVILWGERRLGAAALGTLLSIAERLGLADRDGAGLLEIPAGANGRGLREAGVLPGTGPGYARSRGPGSRRFADCSWRGRGPGHGALPVRDRSGPRPARPGVMGGCDAPRGFGGGPRVRPDRGDRRARQRDLPGRLLRREGRHGRPSRRPHPADADRDRPSRLGPVELVGDRRARAPGRSRYRRADLADGVRAAGRGGAVLSRPDARGGRRAWSPVGRARRRVGDAGGWRSSAADGSRRAAAAAAAARDDGAADDGAGTSNGNLRLGTYRSIWAAPEVEVSPALQYTIPRQQVELSPEDARRLGIADGDSIGLSQNGTRLRGWAHVRSGVPAGTAFLADGISEDSANAFTEPVVEVHKR